MQPMKVAFLLLLSLGLGACFNENHERKIVLGDVSLGDQLIDLKKAHEAEAINSAEYQRMRESLIELLADLDEDDDDDRDNKKGDKDSEDDEGFSWL